MKRRYRPLEALARSDYRISVILPVLSETSTVQELVEWLLEAIAPELEEIIIILSPSSDARSADLCHDLADRHDEVWLHLQEHNPGLGNAVREGYAQARGNLVLNIDSDGEMEKETVPRLIDEMAAGGYEFVAASRWLPGGGFSGYDNTKYVLNWGFQQVFRALFRTDLHDLTYGFKLMRTELVKDIGWRGVFHEIGVETTLKPVRLGASVSEVPTRWTQRVEGATKNTSLKTLRYVGMAVRILFEPPPWDR